MCNYPCTFVAKKPPKRQFTTAHQLQQQKNIKAKQMGSEKWPQEGTRKSPRLNKLGKCNDTPVTCKPTTVKRKLSLQSGPHENETMGENEVEVRCVQFYLSYSILLFQSNFTFLI